MGIPQKDYTGQDFAVTMMELRANPGEVIDRVQHGSQVTITKAGKPAAHMTPGDLTIIHSDGSYTGPRPLTMRRDPGGSY